MYDVLNGTFEAAYHDCMIVANSIVDDKSFQEADTGLILGYLDRITEALEKQIPKKPVKSGVTDSKGIFHPLNGIDGVPYDLCPNCDSNLCTTGKLARRKVKYCQDCGQKLDWSDEE